MTDTELLDFLEKYLDVHRSPWPQMDAKQFRAANRNLDPRRNKSRGATLRECVENAVKLMEKEQTK